MCNNNGILFLILLVKILAIIVIPAYCVYIVSFKKKRINNSIFLLEIIILLLLCVLQLLGNTCVKNSTVMFIRKNNKKITYKDKYTSENANVVKKIITNKIYSSKTGNRVYYFNNVKLPLSDIEVKCKKTTGYMKNYGNNITAIATLLSSKLDRNIDPIEVLKYAKENDLVRCDIGVKTYSLLSIVAKDYRLNIKTISFGDIQNQLNNGNVVLAKVTNKPTVKNITCEDSYIVIYNYSNDNKYMFLNPSDRDYDYVCPANSKGYGTIVKANTNDYFISSGDLNEIGLDYMVLEGE